MALKTDLVMEPAEDLRSLESRDDPMSKKDGPLKLQYDVCGRCGVLFDDQGENGWWIECGSWWHECDESQPARIVVRRPSRGA